MQIRAGSTFDYKTMKAFTRALIGKRTWFLNGILTAVMLFMAVWSWSQGIVDYTLLIMAGILLALDGYLYFIQPGISFRRLGKMKNARCEYVFLDDGMQISTHAEQLTGSSECAYGMIPKVLETPAYLYIYQTKNTVFVVDKATIGEEYMEQLRNTLKEKISGKYTVRKR